jgi:hypothetical protein
MPRILPVSRKLLSCVAPGALVLGLAAAHPAPAEADGDGRVKRVLLISVDGMHALVLPTAPEALPASMEVPPIVQISPNSARMARSTT